MGALCSLLGAGAASAEVRLETDPALHPKFRSGVPDYVSRCVPGEPLRVSVRATAGDRVAVGGRPARTGTFTAEVDRRTGAAVAVRTERKGGGGRTHRIRCLPRDFPRWRARRTGSPQSQWYVVTPIGPKRYGYVAVLDRNAVPVWWMYSSWYGPWDGKLLANGNLIWSRQFNNLFMNSPDVAWEERRLDGSIVRTLRTIGGDTDRHDIVRLPGGNYLLESYRPRSPVDLTRYGGPKDATVYDAAIEEVTPDGELVWSWNSKDHTKLSETTWWETIRNQAERFPPEKRVYDLVHINSVEPDGDGLIVSLRFLDAVLRIDRATGEVTWKLGGTRRSESLKVKGDPRGEHPFGGQHDARLYRDGTLTVYDNGTGRKRTPRAVRYRVDTKARTATLLEDVRSGARFRSGCCGSARKLPGGNWVVYWGGTTLMTEQAPSGKKVLDLFFKDGRHSYRAAPIPRGQLSAAALRRGMGRMAATGGGRIAR